MKTLKSFMLVIFSACFLLGGLFLLMPKKERASAETTIVENVENNLPEYVGVSANGDETVTKMIESDIFLFNNNSLTINFKMNGNSVNEGGGEIYDYVFYPDENNLSHFYFYRVSGTVNLYINGVEQSLAGKEFNTQAISDSGLPLTFANLNDVVPESFEINFADTSTLSEEEAKNTFDIVDETGNLIEGLYTLQVEVNLWECTDGGTTQSEDRFSDSTKPLTYSFFVLKGNSYILNNRPVFSNDNFDSTTTIPTTVSPNFGDYLYSNYSAIDNNIASITYNHTKYDLAITKELNSTYTLATLSYLAENDNGENDGISVEGDSIISYTKNGNQTTVYFYDVGNYSVSFEAVATFKNGENYNKYKLSALANATKKVMVYVYGYQLMHIDYDNNKTFTEFKTYENESGNFDGKFYHSADLTSKFLSSNENYAQNASSSDDKGNITFVESNVLNFIKGIEPESTNQALVRFNSNATISTNNANKSYLYSSSNIGGGSDYVEVGGQKLYRSEYRGGSISDAGTYLLILAYTFENFYTVNAQRDADTIFYQIFYFKINTNPPVLSITDEDGNMVYSDIYTNKNVTVSLKETNVHDKDITVQIYAFDYITESYLDSYGGRSGIDMHELNDNSSAVILKENAHFTIRLYYTNEITDTDIDIVNERIIKQYYFTIDKMPIEDLSARNVSLISGTTNYNILDYVEGVSTNQNIVVSWEDKDSDAETFAYYKYFPIVDSEFYQSNLNISNVLNIFLRTFQGASYMPINNALDLSGDRKWVRYSGNTLGQSTTTTSQFALTEAGLYIFDVYDEAGNHSIKIFIIDNTSPMFALETNSTFSLIPSYHYIQERSTLYWGDYKAISISDPYGAINFPSNIDLVTEDNIASYSLYKDYNGKTSLELYKAFYNLLYAEKYIQFINCTALTGQTNRPYLTFEIDDLVYETPIGSDTYEKATKNKITLDDSSEYTYRVLIRDESNTTYDLSSAEDARIQYTNYYSARQNIIVSHDTSEFRLFYENDNETIYLTSNLMVESEDENGNVLTTYLSPINVNELVYASFIPTVAEDSSTVQIDRVTVDYYAYVDMEKDVDGITHYYRELSDEKTTTFELYNYETGQNTETVISELSKNSDNITNEGMYVITRVYNTTVTPEIDKQDYVTRKFVLYVDRNEVISTPDTKGEGNESHSESLIGGEIYVSMYDSGNNSSLVITFPDSPDGNKNSLTLHDGNENPILYTNKLPVKVYVPTYKYTMYAVKKPKQVGLFNPDGTPMMENGQQVMGDSENEYYYEVVYNTDENKNAYYSLNSLENGGASYLTDDDGNVYINEYRIFAEIYKDPQGGTSAPLYRTTTTFLDPTPTNAESENGFVNFYDATGNKLEYLTTEGKYVVKVYQGYGTDFQQVATFSFVIEKTAPDFDARTTQRGRMLNSTVENGMTVYHTNENNIQLTWDIPRDSYTAGIDTEKFTISGNRIAKKTVTLDELFVRSGQSLDSYYGNLNLAELGVTSHGDYIDITMQYENHSDYYETVTKRIQLDREAPSTNIDNLVTNVINNFHIKDFLRYENFRIKENYAGEVVENENETSYNISSTTGTFGSYAYAVEASFLNTLKRTSSSESPNIYYRVVKDKYKNNIIEATPDTFREGDDEYKLISTLASFEANTYYEIVESDLAGNLTIYTVFVVDYITSDENFAIFEYTENNETKTFSKADYVYAKSSSHNALLSIYAKPGLQLKSFNYFGNVWALFRIDKYVDETLVTNYYLSSPWLADGKVYQIIGTSNNILTLEEVDIVSLIDGSKDTRLKDSLTVYDSTRGTQESFYFNTRNASLTATLSSSAEREYISISQPSNEALESTIAQTYLTSIKIYTPQIVGVSPEVVYYDATNPLGYADQYLPNANVTVSATTTNIIFELVTRNIQENTRIIYQFFDNYGNEYNEIHLYNETTGYKEVDSNNNLYAFYDKRDNNLTYITEDDFAYTYNERKYLIRLYEANNQDLTGYTELILEDLMGEDNEASITLRQNNISGSVIRNTFSIREQEKYSLKFRIDVYDVYAYTNATDGEVVNPIKSIYFILNDQVGTPNANSMTTDNNQFYFTTNGGNITDAILGLSGGEKVTFYSRTTLIYGDTSNNFLPIKYYLSTNGGDYEEVESGTIITCPDNVDSVTYSLKVWYDANYIVNENFTNQLSNGGYIFDAVPEERIYTFTLSSSSQTAFYVEAKDANGEWHTVSRSGITYTNRNGDYQNPNHYIVNINYIDRDSSVRIVTNTEQYITWTQENKVGLSSHYVDADNVRTYIYHISNTLNLANNPDLSNIPPFDAYIAITFIEPTDSIVRGFYSYNSSGNVDTNDNLITKSNFEYIVPSTSSLDRLKIEWSKYYAIKENTISIEIYKNNIKIEPTLFSEKIGGEEYYYTYITRSGSYKIKFVDKAGNNQTFAKNTTSQTSEFSLVFLKDVPFTLSYHDQNSEEVVTSEPVNESTFNGDVTLTIDGSVYDFYLNGVAISVTRNNVDYTQKISETYDRNTRSYTFTETGYYKVTLSATSSRGEQPDIQALTYSFTILNPNEYRYSYIINQYSNYYIEKVERDGVDITSTLLNTLDTKTIFVDGKEYLAELALSYIDEKTGVGVYDITINSNETYYQSENTKSSWTYRVIIEVGTEDLIFSNIAPGATTKSTITLTFNTANVYNEFGNSTLQIIYYLENGAKIVYDSYDITAESTGVQTASITDANTYFVQLVSPSGILLYSYKVIKEDPFNAATIISIVVAILVLIAAIVVIVVLRKHIKVK